ncbi:uncharacterized protein LOC144447332 [Glandiceps talaboti]
MHVFRYSLLGLVFIIFICSCCVSSANEVTEESPTGRCPYTVSATKYFITTKSVLQRITTYTICLDWDLRCTAYRYEQRTVYRVSSRTVEQTLYRPCPACPHNNCTNLCNACVDDNTMECDRDVGICVCHPGWNGTTCNQTCSAGYFGENCVNRCICNDNTTVSCDRLNGTCNCQSGWTGPRCTHEIRKETPKPPTEIVTILKTVTPNTTEATTIPVPIHVRGGQRKSMMDDPGMLAGIVIISIVVIASIVTIGILAMLYKRRHPIFKQKNYDIPNNTLQMGTIDHSYEDADQVHYAVPTDNIYSEVITQSSTPRGSDRSVEVITELKKKLSRENVYVDVDVDDSSKDRVDTPLTGSDDESYQVPRLQNGYPVAMPTDEKYVDMGSTQGEYQVPRQHNIAMETETPYTDMDSTYQVPRAVNNTVKPATEASNEMDHIYNVPRSTGNVTPETDASYMDMNTSNTVPRTGNAAMATDATYADMDNSQDHSHQSSKRKPYTGLYQSPRPQPPYSDISEPVDDPDGHLYNKVDRTKKSYHKNKDTSSQYDNLDNHGNTSPTDDTYDKVSHQGSMARHHGNTVKENNEYAHLKNDGKENPDDGSYNKLNHGSVRSNHHHGYNEGLYENLAQIDDEEEDEDNVDPETVPLK